MWILDVLKLKMDKKRGGGGGEGENLLKKLFFWTKHDSFDVYLKNGLIQNCLSHFLVKVIFEKDNFLFIFSYNVVKKLGKLHWYSLLLVKLDLLHPNLGKWYSVPKFAK